MSTKDILVFKHMQAQNPGIFRDCAEEYCINFHEIDLYAGDEIPTLENYDALWVMGGSMNIWEEDKYPWLIEEKQTIRNAVDGLNMPYLGICFGHQLLGEVMGGTVGPTERWEIGLIDVSATAVGDHHPIFNDLPDPARWVNVHLAEVIEPPPSAKILAASDACPVQLMQIGKTAFSCQFHPEVCNHTVPNWLKIPGTQEKLQSKLGEVGLETFKLNVEKNLSHHNALAETLLSNWINLVFN